MDLFLVIVAVTIYFLVSFGAFFGYTSTAISFIKAIYFRKMATIKLERK